MLKAATKVTAIVFAWLLLAGLCFGTTGLLAVGVVHADTQQSITVFEYQDTGNNSYPLYNKVIGVQTFTTTIAHDVSGIEIFGHITGNPLYVLVQLQTVYASGIHAGEPTGDLVYDWFSSESDVEQPSGYFTGNEDSSWVSCQLGHSAKLEGNTTYAIVVKVPAGDTGNSYSWDYNDGGNLEGNGTAYVSTNGGSTWVEQTDDDFMFKVLGSSGLLIKDVNVYSSFYADDDWLIVCSYLNKAPTYYKEKDIEQYFRLQFVDNATGNVTAETVLRSWDASVASIYINPAEATGLQWEGNYTLRIHCVYGNFNVLYSPSAGVYNILPSEFIGDTLTFLDKWCLSQAQWMGTMNKGDDNYYIRDTQIGKVINTSGIALFDLGIPKLGTIRGEYIYETYIDEAELNPVGAPNPALQNRFVWQTQLGTDMANMLDALGAPFHLGGKVIGLVVMMILYVFVVGGSFPAGHSTAGASVGFIIILIGMIAGVVDVVWVVLAGMIALGLGLRQLILVGQ